MQLRGAHLAFALIQQFDVAAQGYGGDAVLGAIGVLADAHQQRLAEADAEAQNFEAKFLGDPVVPEFVDRHQYPDRDQKGGEKSQHLHAKAPGSCSIKATAKRRAAASASNTSPRALTGDESRRCSTLSMTAAIAVKFKRRSRNAFTATSLAAFSTAGAVPPARAAALASPRLGNRSWSGGSKSSRAIWARFSDCTPDANLAGQASA